MEHLPGTARKRRLDLGVVLPVFAALLIEWVDAERYGSREQEARRRLAGRDEEDWPSVALTLALARSSSVAIWTQDRDFDCTALPTLTTGEILDILEGR